jgi:hypothetical protein
VDDLEQFGHARLPPGVDGLGGSAATTGPIPPTSRTKSKLPWTTRAASSGAARALTRRGTATDDTAAFAVGDRNYLSARWPGDAYLFARRFCDLLQSTAPDGPLRLGV